MNRFFRSEAWVATVVLLTVGMTFAGCWILAGDIRGDARMCGGTTKVIVSSFRSHGRTWVVCETESGPVLRSR